MFGAHERTGLLNMITQHHLQRLMHEVSGGVVLTDRFPTNLLNFNRHFSGVDLLTFHHLRHMNMTLAVFYGIDHSQLKILARDESCIPHLTALFGVKRRFVKNDKVFTVHLLITPDFRLRRRIIVTDKLGIFTFGQLYPFAGICVNGKFSC